MAKGVKIQIIIHKISGSNLKISPHIFSRFNSIQLKEYFHQFDKYSIKEHFTHNNNSSQSIFRSSINTLLNNCSKRLLLNSAVVAPRSSTCVTSINVCGVSWKFCDCFVNKTRQNATDFRSGWLLAWRPIYSAEGNADRLCRSQLQGGGYRLLL